MIQTQKRDQDRFGCYFYNDFTGYGIQEVAENQVSNFFLFAWICCLYARVDREVILYECTMLCDTLGLCIPTRSEWAFFRPIGHNGGYRHLCESSHTCFKPFETWSQLANKPIQLLEWKNEFTKKEASPYMLWASMECFAFWLSDTDMICQWLGKSFPRVSNVQWITAPDPLARHVSNCLRRPEGPSGSYLSYLERI